MLVAAFIALIIFAIGFTILNGATQARANAQKRIRATDGARMFFEMVERDLNDAYPGPWTAPYGKADLIESPGGDVVGNALKMTTSGEAATPSGGFVTVRYYVLLSTKRLYRETTLDPSPGPPALPSTPAHNTAFALLPDVEEVQFDYYEWVEFTKGLGKSVDPLNATHINAQIKILDSDEKTYRLFQRMMVIPTSFPD